MKNYVKPMGTVVAMNLNENIAASQPIVNWTNGFDILDPQVKYISGEFFDPAYPDDKPVAATENLLMDASIARSLAADSNNRYANCWKGWH